MPTLATTVDGLKFKNPFIIASGPPGTNMNVINRAFREGWGGSIAKTVSLDSQGDQCFAALRQIFLPDKERSSAGKTSS